MPVGPSHRRGGSYCTQCGAKKFKVVKKEWIINRSHLTILISCKECFPSVILSSSRFIEDILRK